MVTISFDARTVDPATGGMDVFETGEYTMQIVDSNVVETKNKTGTMLVLTAECLDPEHAKKRLPIRLNVQNPNAQAVEIAFRELSAICHVTGQLQISDSQQLHGKPFKVRVEKVPRGDDPTKFGNEIKGYLDVQGNVPGAASGVAPVSPQPPAQPAATAPAPTPSVPANGSAPSATAAAPATAPAPVAAPVVAAPQAAVPAPAPAPAPTPQPTSAPPWQQATDAPAPPSQQATDAPAPPWQQPG